MASAMTWTPYSPGIEKPDAIPWFANHHPRYACSPKAHAADAVRDLGAEFERHGYSLIPPAVVEVGAGEVDANGSSPVDTLNKLAKELEGYGEHDFPLGARRPLEIVLVYTGGPGGSTASSGSSGIQNPRGSR